MANPNPKSRKGIPNKPKLPDPAKLEAFLRAERRIETQRLRLMRLLIGQTVTEELCDALGEVVLLAKGEVITEERLESIPRYMWKFIRTTNSAQVDSYYDKSQAEIDWLLETQCDHCNKLEMLRRHMGRAHNRRKY